MPTKTAAQAAQKWMSAMQNPQTAQNYINGINATTVNPMQLAASAEAMDNYARGVQRAITNGKRVRKLNSADVGMWKQNATSVGAQNLKSGATKGGPKYTKGVQPYESVWAAMRTAARSLPKGGLQNATNRVNAALAVMMQAAGTA